MHVQIISLSHNDAKNSMTKIIPAIISGIANSGTNNIKPIIIRGIPIIIPRPVRDITKPMSIAKIPAILVIPLTI